MHDGILVYMIDGKEVLIYKANKGEDILANDGNSFAAPYFSKVQEALRKVSSIASSQNIFIYPYNYDEDQVQKLRREDFSPSEWVIASVTLDYSGKIKETLLVHKTHQKEGMVLSYPSLNLVSLFYRGFYIIEFEGAEPIEGSLFLETLGIREEVVISEYDDDDENAPIIEVIRPSFKAISKKKIVNLGYSEIQEIDEDSDEEVEIEVERPAFVASSNKKPRNLGTYGQKKPAFVKRKRPSVIEKPLEKEEPESIASPEKPAFVPSKGGKPIILKDKAEKKILPPRPLPKKEEPEEAKPIEMVEATQIEEEKIIHVEKPEFSPSSGNKPKNLHKGLESRRIVYESIDHATEKKGKETERDPRRESRPAEESERSWTSIDVFKLKPRTAFGEAGLFLKKGESPKTLTDAEREIAGLKSIRISPNCVFVPNVLEDGDMHLGKLSSFDYREWRILAQTLNKNDEPIYNLLQHRKEDGFCILVSLKHRGPHIVMISLKGAAFDDPLFVYMPYAELKKATGFLIEE